ncbi:uncharacterized protein LTR77_006641 [Saxophila tyrrhenica]|uniref:Uncharacterized protein n=1 Tax=Saxophila tyrrhenica TaxID=1690608 RepID=A0AAV9P8C7_9PEZI|nr:hypothetical protein LTR77_006641 [Saxophila tyrrhenica]
MAKKFFSGWEIWEKLVFILACAMVVTVILGSLKLIYAHGRLRKFSAIAEQERVEQSMQRTMSQRSARPESEVVPFGIRAIESGIQVEGLWISRGNTPDPGSENASAASSPVEQSPVKTFNAAVDGQQARSAKADHILSLLRPDFREDLQSRSRTSHDEASEAISKPQRSRYPPLSYAKYEYQPYIACPSQPVRTLEGLDAIHKASTSLRVDEYNTNSDSSHRSSDSTGDIDSISAYAPALFTGQTPSAPKIPSANDLDLLNSRRVFQAAETGQLTPRGRRPGQSASVDLTGLRGPNRLSTSVEGRPSTRSSSSDTGTAAALSSAKIAALPPAVRRSSMPDVTPFTEFCKRTSQDRGPATPRARSRDSALSSQAVSESPVDSAASSPIMLASAGAAELKLPPPKRTSFVKGPSQVVRGHGTGFEILMPGTLNPPMPGDHPMERERAAPPISLQNSSRARSRSEDGKSKLQKKRQPSMDSSSSRSTASRRSRISLFA